MSSLVLFCLIFQDRVSLCSHCLLYSLLYSISPGFFFLKLEEEEQEDQFDLTVGITDPEKIGKYLWILSMLP